MSDAVTKKVKDLQEDARQWHAMYTLCSKREDVLHEDVARLRMALQEIADKGPSGNYGEYELSGAFFLGLEEQGNRARSALSNKEAHILNLTSTERNEP